MSRLEDYRKVITYSNNKYEKLSMDELLLLLLTELIDDPQITEVVNKYVNDWYEDSDKINEELLLLRTQVNNKSLPANKLPNITIITTEKQLSKFTGLSSEELWNHNFNLDDWDICFVTNRPLSNNWLLRRMESYCCGYERVDYDGLIYYLVYHA